MEEVEQTQVVEVQMLWVEHLEVEGLRLKCQEGVVLEVVVELACQEVAQTGQGVHLMGHPQRTLEVEEVQVEVGQTGWEVVEHQQTADGVYQLVIMGSELPEDVQQQCHGALLCCPS